MSFLQNNSIFNQLILLCLIASNLAALMIFVANKEFFSSVVLITILVNFSNVILINFFVKK
jgi:hypothetical protein